MALTAQRKSGATRGTTGNHGHTVPAWAHAPWQPAQTDCTGSRHHTIQAIRTTGTARPRQFPSSSERIAAGLGPAKHAALRQNTPVCRHPAAGRLGPAPERVDSAPVPAQEVRPVRRHAVRAIRQTLGHVPFETLCASNHTVCRFAEPPQCFRSLLAGRHGADASRSSFFNGNRR